VSDATAASGVAQEPARHTMLLAVIGGILSLAFLVRAHRDAKKQRPCK
jgi:hypothetical protein